MVLKSNMGGGVGKDEHGSRCLHGVSSEDLDNVDERSQFGAYSALLL